MIRIFDNVATAHEALIAHRQIEDADLPESVRDRIRVQWGEDLSAEQVVDRVIDLVRRGGDAALRELALRIEGVALTAIEVGREEIQSAYRQTEPAVVDALRLASDRVRAFHERGRRHGWHDFAEGYGQIVRPLERVGLYAPGGTAPLPSTVIMTAVPAKVAGVREIFVTTPTGRDGRVAPVTLVAADIAGADRVFRIGGAQAIAAFAFGTQTIPQVDKIFGPGNLFVSLAKRRVFGRVAIDSIAGPTETLIVADDSADSACCAADMLAQAEHDLLAQPIMITTSRRLAERVAGEIEKQLPLLEREVIARGSVERRGAIVVVPDLQVAFDLANDYAPEHLCLVLREPWHWIGAVRNAGGIFVGEQSTEALGDYIIGPSHVMPTGGTARFNSPLNVDDFLKVISVFAISPEQARRLTPPTAAIARAEGLTGHARSVEIRLERAP